MAELSTAVGLDRVSRVVGYSLEKGPQEVSGVNLPMRIAVLGPVNHANQASLGVTPVPTQVITAQQAANLYGYGSPMHQMVRILLPLASDGVGGIPVVCYPQKEAAGATASSLTVTVTGTATKNVAHRLRIAGRNNVDGEFYEFVALTTDSITQIAAKIADAVNNVIGSPVTASAALGVVTLTTKWYGSTSAGIKVEVDTQGDSAGLTYAVSSVIAGTGTDVITDALNQFGSTWNPLVINPYGVDKHEQLELFNGVPGATPTGRYAGIVFKPFVALWGSSEATAATIAAITGAAARSTQVTNVLCPAPNSKAFAWEAAANMAVLLATTAQNTPHLDVNGKSYLDMPIPVDGQIGDMADYSQRDYLVKNGASTVELVAGKYQVQDLVTTYHPDGEIVPQFRYVRNIIVDWNVKYGYTLLENDNVRDKAIVKDSDFVSVSGVVKAKQWKAVLYTYFEDLASRALIADPDFSKSSLQVQISPSNPDRLNSRFGYKRTGVARIASTTAEANFNYES